MSRAFVRESDDRPELPIARQASALPAGAKNYITAGGATRLREALRKLVEEDRPRLVSPTDNPEAKRQLLVADQQIQQMEEQLESAEIVAAPAGNQDIIRFGATVTVRRQNGEKETYRIVGVDEMDLDRDWVSWISPIAKALLNGRLGERVRFKFPSGEELLEIMKIEYEDV